MRDIAIFAGLIALSVFWAVLNSGCSYHIRVGHTSSSSDVAENRQSSSQTYVLSSFDSNIHFMYDIPIVRGPTVQDINNALREVNPHRFSYSESAIPFDVIGHTPVYKSLPRLPSYLLCIFTLGVFPGGLWSEANYGVDVVVYGQHGSANHVYNGKVESSGDFYMSMTSPFGLIYWGDRRSSFRGDAQTKGSYILIAGKKRRNRVRNTHSIAIAKEINALLNKYEATQHAHPGLSSNNVSNIRIQQHDEALIIMYDLSERSDIEVHFSVDGGLTFRGPVMHVIGAVGRNIAPERDKVIVWDVGSELGSVDYENTVVKIVSTVPN